jgi:1-pyrroline-5-carboxylate dehydrogenase
MPITDMDMVNCQGPVMQSVLESAQPRITQFTGSTAVGEALSKALKGRVKLEDSGLDWKIFGPDVGNVDYAAWVCDQDAYAFSGQKCSAQSLLFVHSNWVKAGLIDRMAKLAKRRSLKDLTIGPVLSVTTETAMKHIKQLLDIPGAKLVFGGKPLNAPHIPSCYGAWEPTAIFVPILQVLQPEYFSLCTREIFGPLQVITHYENGELDLVLRTCEELGAHLTAAIVSSDRSFQRAVLGYTVNGTTYCGARARTTGAPQNHWFGPAGDPRAAGIGTREAIRMVWSCHREIIMDEEMVPENWITPPAT